MKPTTMQFEQTRKPKARFLTTQHYEATTGNASRSGQFFGISPTHFYIRTNRLLSPGAAFRAPRSSSPSTHEPAAGPIPTAALILRLRLTPACSATTRSRFTGHRLVNPTEHRMPRSSLKGYRPGPRRRRENHLPRQSIQVDVTLLKQSPDAAVSSPRSPKGTR